VAGRPALARAADIVEAQVIAAAQGGTDLRLLFLNRPMRPPLAVFGRIGWPQVFDFEPEYAATA